MRHREDAQNCQGVTKEPNSTVGSSNPAPVMCYSPVKKCSPDGGCLIQLSCFLSTPFDYELAKRLFWSGMSYVQDTWHMTVER